MDQLTNEEVPKKKLSIQEIYARIAYVEGEDSTPESIAPTLNQQFPAHLESGDRKRPQVQTPWLNDPGEQHVPSQCADGLTSQHFNQPKRKRKRVRLPTVKVKYDPFSSLSRIMPQKTVRYMSQKLTYFPSISMIIEIHDSKNALLFINWISSRFGPQIRQLQICGCNFKIAANSCFDGGLFNAISQALTGYESSYNKIQKRTRRDILKKTNWEKYQKVIKETYGLMITDFRRSLPNWKIKKLYVKSRNTVPATLIDLHAAALIYGFNFTTVTLIREGDGTRYFQLSNCQDPEVIQNSVRNKRLKYYFYQSGRDWMESHWEFLVPIGNFTDIKSGYYPCTLKNSILWPLRYQSQYTPSKPKKLDYIPFSDKYSMVVITNRGADYVAMSLKGQSLKSILSLHYTQLNPEKKPYEIPETTSLEPLAYYSFYSNILPSSHRGGMGFLGTVKRSKPPRPIFKSPTEDYREWLLDRFGNPRDLRVMATILNFNFIVFGLCKSNQGFTLRHFPERKVTKKMKRIWNWENCPGWNDDEIIENSSFPTFVFLAVENELENEKYTWYQLERIKGQGQETSEVKETDVVDRKTPLDTMDEELEPKRSRFVCSPSEDFKVGWSFFGNKKKVTEPSIYKIVPGLVQTQVEETTKKTKGIPILRSPSKTALRNDAVLDPSSKKSKASSSAWKQFKITIRNALFK